MGQAILSAEGWTALATGATAAVLLGTLGYIARQVGEAEKLRHEQFRPWVTVSFRFRSIIAFIAIRNLGTTVARKVRIRFEPELVSTVATQGFGDVAIFKEGIPTLAPGEQYLVLFDRTPDRMSSDLPARHTAHVEYEDHRARKLGPDEFVLDFNVLFGGILPDKGMHDLVEEVRQIREHVVKE